MNPTPAIGRMLWFYPSVEYAAKRGMHFDPRQPLAAQIVYVHGPAMVNLAVFDTDGQAFGVTSVPLATDDNPHPVGSFHAAWMPYQKGQAADQQRSH